MRESSTTAGQVEGVFPFLADPASIPRWRPDVLETRGDGPLQAGSEFDEVLNFGGRKTQTFRVTVFEANNTLEVAAIAGLGIRPTQRYSVSSKAAITMASIRVTVRAQGLFRAVEPLLPRMIASKWRDYSARLRKLLETQPVVMSREAQVAEA